MVQFELLFKVFIISITDDGVRLLYSELAVKLERSGR